MPGAPRETAPSGAVAANGDGAQTATALAVSAYSSIWSKFM
jgi:hypothetical protein